MGKKIVYKRVKFIYIVMLIMGTIEGGYYVMYVTNSDFSGANFCIVITETVIAKS